MSELETVVEEPDRLDNFEVEEPVESSDAIEQPPLIEFKSAGFAIRPIDVEAALRALDSLCEGDPEEQRETFEYLKRALNETRAANGERLLFPDE